LRAMVLRKPAPIGTSPLELTQLPAPEPAPGQMRLKVVVCGLCHTDLHTVEGDLDLPALPIVPGHQVVGFVDKLGQGVDGFQLGERVGMAWLYDSCGQCAFCLSDRENLCLNGRFTGLHVDGGYADFALVKPEFAYRIPEQYGHQEAAPLLCGGIIGYRSLRLSGVQGGQRLGLWGFGASAHIAIQVARHWGCECYVFTRSPEHQELAKRLGAVWVGTAQQSPPKLMHSSIVFAPAGPLVPRALELLEKGGALALAGIYMTPIPRMDYATHLYQEKRITSVANATRLDGREMMRIAGETKIETHTEAFPLESANHALQLLKRSKLKASAVLKVSG